MWIVRPRRAVKAAKSQPTTVSVLQHLGGVVDLRNVVYEEPQHRWDRLQAIIADTLTNRTALVHTCKLDLTWVPLALNQVANDISKLDRDDWMLNPNVFVVD
eukprot:jgi/Tetstr1/438581/TSEL_027132.t1